MGDVLRTTCILPALRKKYGIDSNHVVASFGFLVNHKGIVQVVEQIYEVKKYISDIRIRKIVLSGGSLVLHDQLGYDDAQPANHPSVNIGSIPDVFGIEIAMRQTLGTLLTIETEFYVSKVLGTS